MRQPKPYKDITGMTFGRLVVKSFHRMNDHKQSMWLCVCQCGKEIITLSNSLKTGNTTSCGCIFQGCVSHGHAVKRRTPTYRSWQAMLTRTTNPNSFKFPLYGGRGITVCDRWRDSFVAFLEDMGERPPDRTLDRIDPNGNYTPENCRWATDSQQRSNKRKKCQ